MRAGALDRGECLLAVALDEQDREVVVGEAGDDVLVADARPQRSGDLVEHEVADLGARSVVQRLEAVDIGDRQRERPPVPPRPTDLLVEPFGERAAVGEAGERVDRGVGIQPRAVLRVDDRCRDEACEVL